MERLDIVLPVFNEEHILVDSTRALRSHCAANLDCDWRIVIADNGSTDNTVTAALGLARQCPEVRVMSLGEKGRGRALRSAWAQSDADYLCYMDVDLSSDLSFLPPLIRALRDGYDMAVGSRLLPEATTIRGPLRELLSRSYNLLLQETLSVKFSDAQCGFKAITRAAAKTLLPQVTSQQWFFDTELLVLAERLHFRIKEVPIVWVENPDSRVNVCAAILEDLHGILLLKARLLLGRWPRQ